MISLCPVSGKMDTLAKKKVVDRAWAGWKTDYQIEIHFLH